MGEPKHSKRYCGQLAPSVTCLAQQDENPYLLYGLQQGGLKELMSLDVVKAGYRAFQQGYVGGTPIGDTRMMPGNFIVDQNGIVQYVFYAKHAGDHLLISDLLAVGQQLKEVK